MYQYIEFFFNPNELDEGDQVGINSNIGIGNLLTSMRATQKYTYKYDKVFV